MLISALQGREASHMELGLTSAEKAARLNSIGGSDCNIIMSGDEEKLVQLWRIKRGEVEADDLSNVLPVQLGQWTEEFNRLWYSKQTGRPVHSAGNVLRHPKYDFLHYSLDGITINQHGDDATFEAKHVNPFTYDRDAHCTKYMGQMQHGMVLGKFNTCVMSVLIGTLKWEYIEVEADIGYQAELLDRCLAFWTCVKSGTPPAALPEIAAPKNGNVVRIADMNGNNEWAYHAADWIENQEASKKFWKASDGIKALVESDVKVAKGHGIQCKRDAKGALRISADKGER